MTVFYVDLGMTVGMMEGIQDCEESGAIHEVRRLGPEWYVEICRRCKITPTKHDLERWRVVS